MSDTLPIDRAPTARYLTPEQLSVLNQSLLTAQHRAEVARRTEAEAQLAQVDARLATDRFITVRQEISNSLGISLGNTHIWVQLTGEVREASA